MKKVAKSCAFTLIVVVLFQVAGIQVRADSQYQVIDEAVFRLVEDELLELQDAVVCPLGKQGKQYFILHDFLPGKLDEEQPGAYIFDSRGNQIDRIPLLFGQSSTGIYLSPDENYLAADEGTWVVRELWLYTFPELEELGVIVYTGVFEWPRDDVIFYTALSAAERANFPCDPCAYPFVAMYDLSSRESVAVQMHDELTEYSLKSATRQELILRKVSVESLQDWEEPRLWQEEEITIENPLWTNEAN